MGGCSAPRADSYFQSMLDYEPQCSQDRQLPLVLPGRRAAVLPGPTATSSPSWSTSSRTSKTDYFQYCLD